MASAKKLIQAAVAETAAISRRTCIINGLEPDVPLGQQVDRIFSKCRPDRASRWRFVDISLLKLTSYT
jgi:hypothetical protein